MIPMPLPWRHDILLRSLQDCQRRSSLPSSWPAYYDERQLGFAPKQSPLVIAISNSGGIARVGEAVQRVVQHGGFALGVTGNMDSLLGRSASRVVHLEIPPFESAPGARSYLVSVLLLLLLAIRLGEVRGRYTMDQAMAYRDDILVQAAKQEALLPGNG